MDLEQRIKVGVDGFREFLLQFIWGSDVSLLEYDEYDQLFRPSLDR